MCKFDPMYWRIRYFDFFDFLILKKNIPSVISFCHVLVFSFPLSTAYIHLHRE
jgi:hypothetical protein